LLCYDRRRTNVNGSIPRWCNRFRYWIIWATCVGRFNRILECSCHHDTTDVQADKCFPLSPFRKVDDVEHFYIICRKWGLYSIILATQEIMFMGEWRDVRGFCLLFNETTLVARTNAVVDLIVSSTSSSTTDRWNLTDSNGWS